MPRFVPRFVLLAGFSGALACSASTEPRPPHFLRVDVEVSNDTLAQGEATLITVTVTNLSPIHATVTGSGTCIISFIVFNSIGQEVAPGGVCTLDLRPLRFAPGESITKTIEWRGDGRGSGPPVQLPGGDYRIAGLLDAQEGNRVSKPVPVHITSQ